jgi:hypothetical protein
MSISIQVSIERLSARRGHGPCRRERDAEERVRSESASVGRAVKLNESRIQ